MENLESEISQKMRSAVKAKLIELGTGGSSGYIDDELPDYVMVMVANKRSKQQMIGDLDLFLGSQTQLFVTWLHEVLQKLEEFTVPAAVAQKVKRKAIESDLVVTKRERKEKKKGKKGKKSFTDKSTSDISSSSITDIFSNQLIQEAKKSFDAEPFIKKQQTDEFDIPTISEIQQQNDMLEISKVNDLLELQALQKRIEVAKKQLQDIESNESEDEDFLNIKEEAELFDEEISEKANKRINHKNPIHSTNELHALEKDATVEQIHNENRNKHIPITFGEIENEISTEKQTTSLVSHKKKSIHERLGFKSKKKDNIISLSANRRIEKELYIPLHLRKDSEKEKDKLHTNDRNVVDTNKIEKNVIEKRENLKNIKKRIGSRIIIASNKVDMNDNESDDNITSDKSVNSKILVKPRPIIPINKQASKNLLLRAVAEAQRSTALIKPITSNSKFTMDSDSKSLDKTTNLYTKSYRDRNRQNLIKKNDKDNIVVEINTNNYQNEYIPEPISDHESIMEGEYSYIPMSIEPNEESDEDSLEVGSQQNRTQFVVTLNDKIRSKSFTQAKIQSNDNLNGVQVKRVEKGKKLESSSRKLLNSGSSSSKDLIIKNTNRRNDSKYEQNTLKKTVVKNDANDDENLFKSKNKFIEERSTTPPLPKELIINRRKPIKFDLDNVKTKENKKCLEQVIDTNDKTRRDCETQKVTIKKTEASKKYDHLPELLSSVSIETSTIKPKSKERCKYFPNCSKGDTCEFIHPSTPCKAFPNCKYLEKCLYIHPKCKFDLTCNKIGCNFSHNTNILTSVAPPLSSHVVPVQNYKSVSATPLTALCKYYPKCSNTLCTFYHPKLCRFGKNCMNKVECNFYHYDLPPAKDKFKWVASTD